jgi:hypothetical protein
MKKVIFYKITANLIREVFKYLGSDQAHHGRYVFPKFLFLLESWNAMVAKTLLPGFL